MIKLMKSTFYAEAETKNKLADFIMDAEILSMGAQCQEFEKRFAEKQERKHAVFVSSGSMANLILIQALLNLGLLRKGQRVGVSALTWATNVMPIIQLGLTPVLLDVEKETLNVSSSEIERRIGDIDVLFLTNALGFCSDISNIKKLADENDILFIEDNCESLGTRLDGKLLGNFGLASTFSTFVGHHLSTIEGGFICTDSDDLRDMLVMVRAHGWDRNLSDEVKSDLLAKHEIDDFYGRYTFYDLAYNGRPTEINGLIGNTQIGYWDEIVEKRQANFKRFSSVIEQNDDLMTIKHDHLDIVSNFATPVIARTAELFAQYKQLFQENDVEIRPIIAGDMSKQPFFRKYVQDSGAANENANLIHQNGFYFPNNPELTEAEVTMLCQLLQKQGNDIPVQQEQVKTKEEQAA